MRSILRVVAYAFYYAVAYRLPENHWVGGAIWNAIRVACARQLLRECGKDIHIDRRVNFGAGSKLTLKDHAGIGQDSRIIGDVTLGEYVATGFGIVITACDRNLSRTDIPTVQQHVGFDAPVVIGRDCVLFAQCMIMPGVTIGEGCIVAAGAVVARDVPPFAIVGGNPARVVKWRKVPEEGTVRAGMVSVAIKALPPRALKRVVDFGRRGADHGTKGNKTVQCAR